MKFIKQTVGRFVDKYVLNFAAESSTILQPSNTQSQRDRDPEVKIRKKQMECSIMLVDYFHMVYFLEIFRMVQRKEMDHVSIIYENSVTFQDE